MGFECGIVGLPNAGKSTLFNALSESRAAAAENYPFCTIEPNVGRVAVPDGRLDTVARLAGSSRIVPARLGFVDIAGLVRGASRGAGLGNQFLARIREVDAIVHVVRCFEDTDVSHPTGAVDPASDAEIVETELMLADLEQLERSAERLIKKARGGDTEAKALMALIERARTALEAGGPARTAAPGPADEAASFRSLGLLTGKPAIVVCNVDEAHAASGNALSERAEAWATARGLASLVISAALEAEIAALDEPAMRAEFLSDSGIEEPGLVRLVRAGYAMLGLITFFTANRNEAHAWTVPRGATAAQAAGAVHTDFARGFVRAETIATPDYIECGGEAGAREAGVMRLEGKDYAVQDGDILRFRSSA